MPVVTPLDDAGRLIERDLRAVVAHVAQAGHGADSVFYAGTTGEWDKVDGPTREATIRVCAGAVTRLNRGRAKPLASWAGITAPTIRETIEHLALAIECGADAVVLSPLAIHGVTDPVAFVEREIVPRAETGARPMPLLLYDNADIAADPERPYLLPDEVEALARVDLVRGFKVSAPLDLVLRHADAIARVPAAVRPGLMVGYGSQIFDLFLEPATRTRFRPAGLVCGHANVLPREWALAWRLARDGDGRAAAPVRALLDAFRAATFTAGGARPVIACFKRALWLEGVVSSACVAEGTPKLEGSDAERFDQAWLAWKERARGLLDEASLSRAVALSPGGA